MTDNISSVDPAIAPSELNAPVKSSSGLLGTTTGKLGAGGVALVLVVGAIAAAVFFFVMGGALDGAVDQTPKAPVVSAPQEPGEVARVPVNPAQRSLASTFTFRNIFAPTVKRTFDSTATGSTTDGTTGGATGGTTNGTTDGTTDPGVDVPSDTLFLQSIISENGEPMAIFIWNGQTYTVGENDQVGTSPWKVLKINSTSALMLFGDSQVTLSVGQGVGK